MKKYFEGRVIWLTGASSGIGEALALELASLGAKLIISARRREVLESVRSRMVSPAREQAKILTFDLAETSKLESISQEALQQFGHIDIVILNGGIAQRGLARKTLLEVDRELMEVDYFSNVAITKALTPHFIERNKGHIVVVSSVMGFIGTPFRSGYAAAKHALHGYYDSLRAEFWHKHRGVLVSLVCPGWIKTNITINAVAGDGSRLNQMDKTTAHGMDPHIFARKMLRGVASGRRTMVIGGLKERAAVLLQRFFPGLFAVIVRSAKVR